MLSVEIHQEWLPGSCLSHGEKKKFLRQSCVLWSTQVISHLINLFSSVCYNLSIVLLKLFECIKTSYLGSHQFNHRSLHISDRDTWTKPCLRLIITTGYQSQKEADYWIQIFRKTEAYGIMLHSKIVLLPFASWLHIGLLTYQRTGGI